MNNTILVTGVGGPAGKAVTAFLRNRGIKVIGTDIRDVDNHVDEFHVVPRGDDPQFVDALLELLKETHPSLMIPTVSEELPAVSRIRSQIRALGVTMFISDPDVVDLANDKLMTATRLSTQGIPVPRTFSLSPGIDPGMVGRELGYPFIVKPRVGRGGRGVTLYQKESEAHEERRENVVCQQFMPGEECDLNMFVHPAGRVKAIVVLQKTLMKQGIVGNALSVQRVVARDMAEIGLRVARGLALEGPVDMDVRRDRNGVPSVLEINARVGANVLAASEVLESLLMTAGEGVLA